MHSCYTVGEQFIHMTNRVEKSGAVAARVSAWLVDVGLIIFVCVYLEDLLAGVMKANDFNASLVTVSLAAIGFLFKDVVNGQSIGKRIVGIRVVRMGTKGPIGAFESVKRNGVLLSFVILAIVLAESAYYVFENVVVASVAALIATGVVVGACGGYRLNYGRTLWDRIAETMVVPSITVVYQPLVTKTTRGNETMQNPVDKYYKVAALEVALNRVKPESWARALSSANGDQGRYSAEYIKHRVAQLRKG